MTITFKTPIALVLSAAALSIAASPMIDEKTPKPVPEYCTLGSVLGANVSMRPGDQAVHDAAKKNETAARPVGKVADLLIDSGSGQARWVVVAFDKTLGFGGKSVAIPCGQLHWNVAEDRFDLDQSDDKLKELPAFDCADAKKHGLEISVASLAKHWPAETARPVDDGKNQQRPSITIDGKKFDCAKPGLVLVTDIMNDAVYANSEKFGTVTGGLIDHESNRIDFLIVSRGGTLGIGAAEYLIPYYAVCTHGGNDGTDTVYSCLHSVKELEAGVRYLKPEKGAVDAEAVRRTNEAFAADSPKRRVVTPGS